MPNFYAEFRKTRAPSQQQVGTVIVYADDIATVELPGGVLTWAKGETQVRAKVFIQDGKVIGLAAVAVRPEAVIKPEVPGIREQTFNAGREASFRAFFDWQGSCST